MLSKFIGLHIAEDDACCTGPKLLWMQRHEPENYAAMATMLLPASYMNFVMTGQKVRGIL